MLMSNFIEVPDGVNVIIVGRMEGVNGTVAMCGGNCAIQGFDGQGNDVFWTVSLFLSSI